MKLFWGLILGLTFGVAGTTFAGSVLQSKKVHEGGSIFSASSDFGRDVYRLVDSEAGILCYAAYAKDGGLAMSCLKQ